MMKSVFIVGLLYTQGTFAACNPNNCQRALYKSADLVNSFCPGYLSTPGMAIPDYLAAKCGGSAAKVSSACSCLGATATAAPTSTSTSTATPDSTCDASCIGTVTATLTGTVTLPGTTGTFTVPGPTVTIPGPPPPPITVTDPPVTVTTPVTIPGPPPPPITVTIPGPPVTIPGPPPPPVTVTEPGPPVTIPGPPPPPVTVTIPGPPPPPLTVTATQTTCIPPAATTTACPVPSRAVCPLSSIAIYVPAFDPFFTGTCLTAVPGTEINYRAYPAVAMITDCVAVATCAGFTALNLKSAFTMSYSVALNVWECRIYNSVLTIADINTPNTNVGRVYGLNLKL